MKKAEMSPKSILIVDDDDTLRNAIAFDFKRRGYNVYTAKDGLDALEIVKTQSVDAVITDVRMPKKNGIELLDNIKEFNLKIPVVIFVTGISDLTLVDAYDKGACAVMNKPFDRKELLHCIERSLMASSEKLAQPMNDNGNNFKIEFKVQESSSSPASTEARLISIGQGGMFLAMDKELPEAGHTVFFKIEQISNSLVLLQGQGVVRWVRAEFNEEGFPKGFGVEFIFLDENCRKKVLEFIESLHTKAFIPKAP